MREFVLAQGVEIGGVFDSGHAQEGGLVERVDHAATMMISMTHRLFAARAAGLTIIPKHGSTGDEGLGRSED